MLLDTEYELKDDFSIVETVQRAKKRGETWWGKKRGQIMFFKDFYIYFGCVGSSLLVAMSQGYTLVAVCRFVIAVTSLVLKLF